MRESGSGRGAVPIWGNTQPPQTTPAYAVGERVFGAIDDCPGTVVHVSNVVAALVSVEWSDGKEAVIYPANTIMIRKAWPWE